MSLFDLVPPSLVRALGVSLAHSTWQAALIAAACAVEFRRASTASANSRYLVACIGLFALPIVFGATLLAALAHPDRSVLFLGGLPAVLPLGGALSRALTDAGVEVLPFAVTGWLAGVALLSIRLVGGWAYLRWVCRKLAPADPSWQLLVADLSARLGVRRHVTLLQSGWLDAPVTVGCLEPVILVPIALLTATPRPMLAAILAHELAHVRRHDFLLNLVQTVVETLFFFHPAAWWLSRRIRVEREFCCDDLAVAAAGDARLYTRALVGLAERRAQLVLAPRATGGSLRDRVYRLACGEGVRSEARWPVGLAGALIGAALAGLIVGSRPPAGEAARLGGAATIATESECHAAGSPTARCREVARLTAGLADPAASARQRAVRQLEALGDLRVVPALTRALRDPDAGVRRDAAEALDALEDRRAVRPLAETLIRDAVAVVRREAAEALGEIGDPRAVEVLLLALSDTSEHVRRETADALGSIRDRRAVGGLLGLVEDFAPDVRREAAKALGELGDPRARDALRRLLRDPHGEVRAAARHALERLSA